MIKDKHGLQFKSALFAFVAVSILAVSISLWFGEWNTDYSSGITSDLEEYNKLSELSGEASSQRGNITVRSSTSTLGEDFEGTSIRGVFGVLNTMHAAFSFVLGEGGMAGSVAERFGVPIYLLQALIILVTFAITFSLIAILFKIPRKSA